METSKIVGIVLLTVGVLLIVAPLWQTYSIFTGKTMPTQVFKRPVSLKVSDNVSALDIQGQVQNAVIKILPVDSINNVLNLASCLLLIWIVIYGGSKIAEIGVKLIK